VYNGKNKKSVTIKIPKIYLNTRYRFYDVEKFTVKYSNNKKEYSSKFSSTKYSYDQQRFTGKKTTITRLHKFKINAQKFFMIQNDADVFYGKGLNSVKYTIKANKKTAKIKKISMEFEYYDSKSGENKYKTIQINGKGKNTVVKNVPSKYWLVSAKVTY